MPHAERMKNRAAHRFFSGSVSSTCLPVTRNTCIHMLPVSLGDKCSTVSVLPASRGNKWYIKPLFVPIHGWKALHRQRQMWWLPAGRGESATAAVSWFRKKHSFILCWWVWTQAECVCKWLGCHCGLAPIWSCKPGLLSLGRLGATRSQPSANLHGNKQLLPPQHSSARHPGGERTSQLLAVTNSKFPGGLGTPERRLHCVMIWQVQDFHNVKICLPSGNAKKTWLSFLQGSAY